jgi:hypothetical protein
MQNVMRLYGSTNSGGTTDALASAEVAKTGFIAAMLLEMAADGIPTASTSCSMEVSFGSKSGFFTNDTRQAIGGLETTLAFGTQGAINYSRQIALDGLRIPVQPGEKVYLHVNNGGLNIRARACLYLKTQ